MSDSENFGANSGQPCASIVVGVSGNVSGTASPRPRTALALVESLGHVCYRYRIGAFRSTLVERGLILSSVPLRRNTLLRTPQLLAAGRCDLLILQRKLLPFWQLSILRRMARALVFDMDDAIFQRDSFHPRGPESRKLRNRFSRVVRAANAVIVGNEYLKRNAAVYCGASRVHIVPTCVEPSRYPLSRHCRQGGEVRMVWIGSASTLRGLAPVQPHLAAATSRLPGLQTRIICDRSVELAGVDLVFRPWAIHTETEELAACDIGFSWLPDDAWSRGKCGLKVLQYMAAGLPVVANPVGMNRQMVIHGRTGFLASTPGEWANAIAVLAADPQLRRAMGRAGRRLVEEQYNAALWGPRLADILETVAK